MNSAIENHIQRLGRPDIEARHETAAALVKAGDSAIPPLWGALASTNILARRGAIKALTEIGGEVKHLALKALVEERESVYTAIASVLGSKLRLSPHEALSSPLFSPEAKHALLNALPNGVLWRGFASVEDYCKKVSESENVPAAVREGARQVWENRTSVRASRAPENENELLRPAYNAHNDKDGAELLRAMAQGEGAAPKSAPKAVAPSPNAKYIVNPKDGAEAAYIPGGLYRLGRSDEYGNSPHFAALFGFHLCKNSVTVGQYEAYCKAAGAKMPDAPDFNKDWNRKDYPVVNVSWHEARAYAKWAGGDLPTEAEREASSRGGLRGREYPWGDGWDASKCASSVETHRDGAATAGSFPANGYGLHDMAGNVWEWCLDAYDAEYWEAERGVEPVNLRYRQNDGRVLRGGSWYSSYPGLFRCAYRYWLDPHSMGVSIGFRVVFRGLQ